MSAKRLGVWLFMGLGLIGLLTAGTLALVRHYRIARFATVVEGQVYRSGQPLGKDWDRLCSRYEIRSVINLRPLSDRGEDNWFDEEQQAVTKHGLKWFDLPMPEQWPTKDQADRVLAILSDPTNQPVLVHCKQGKDRTGIMTALYRIHVQGWSERDALDEMTSLRDRPPSPDMLRFIRNYRPAGSPTTSAAD